MTTLQRNLAVDTQMEGEHQGRVDMRSPQHESLLNYFLNAKDYAGTHEPKSKLF